MEKFYLMCEALQQMSMMQSQGQRELLLLYMGFGQAQASQEIAGMDNDFSVFYNYIYCFTRRHFYSSTFFFFHFSFFGVAPLICLLQT